MSDAGAKVPIPDGNHSAPAAKWEVLEPLETRIAHLLKSSEAKRSRYRKLGARLFLVQALLVSSSTVLIAVSQSGGASVVGIGALVASAGASFLAVTQSYFLYRDRWQHYTDQVFKLHAMESLIQRRKALAIEYHQGVLTEGEVDDLYDTFEQAMNSTMTRWSAIAASFDSHQLKGPTG